MKQALQKYNQLLEAMDNRFQTLRRRYPRAIACASGCAACCHGFFDISLADSLRLWRGYTALAPAARAEISHAAIAAQKGVTAFLPDLTFPYLLDSAWQPEIDRLTDAMPDARCPFMDERNHCFVYADRPLACRLEGLPMIDKDDGLFDDWCARNFPALRGGQKYRDDLPAPPLPKAPDGLFGPLANQGAGPIDYPSPAAIRELTDELTLDYYAITDLERAATACLSAALAGQSRDDLTVLIPSVIVAGADIWQPLLEYAGERL